MIFQPAHSSLRSQVAGASPNSSGRKAGPHPHQHSVRLGQFGHAGSPHMYLFQTWEEESPQRKPTQTGGERADSSTQTVAPARNRLFSLLM